MMKIGDVGTHLHEPPRCVGNPKNTKQAPHAAPTKQVQHASPENNTTTTQHATTTTTQHATQKVRKLQPEKRLKPDQSTRPFERTNQNLAIMDQPNQLMTNQQ